MSTPDRFGSAHDDRQGKEQALTTACKHASKNHPTGKPNTSTCSNGNRYLRPAKPWR